MLRVLRDNYCWFIFLFSIHPLVIPVNPFFPRPRRTPQHHLPDIRYPPPHLSRKKEDLSYLTKTYQPHQDLPTAETSQPPRPSWTVYPCTPTPPSSFRTATIAAVTTKPGTVVPVPSYAIAAVTAANQSAAAVAAAP
ncbi:hypothetical protein PLESTF_000119400 [Pleodorina starrii]|nr:hypothetical protein PLESTF_000119400 [Pleodorina starrii]